MRVPHASLARRVALRALLGLAISGLALAAGPVSTAGAHAGLLSASPEYEETVAGAPEQVRLRFNEPVEAVFEPVEVRNGHGERVDLDDARTEPEKPEVVTVGLREVLPAGEYAVDWRVTSQDGHPVSGEYVFTVAGTDDAGAVEEPVPTSTASRERPGLPVGVLLGGLLAGSLVAASLISLRRSGG